MESNEPILTMPLKVEKLQSFLVESGFVVDYVGEPDVEVSGFSDPSSYSPGTAVWLGSLKYLKLDEGRTLGDVTLLFAARSLEGIDDFPAVMVCDDPRDAFMAVVEACSLPRELEGVHKMAVVSPLAELGERVAVGPHAVVEAGAVVGDGTVIEAGAVIRGCVTIGARCHIYPNCVIGSEGFGFRKGSDGMTRLPHLGSVAIGDDVEIGAGSVVDRGTFRETTIGSGTKIDGLSGIGHNAQIGERCIIVSGSIGGNCEVGDGCELVHAVLKNRISIGSNVKVGIGSVVLRDVEAGCECFGNPARVVSRKGAQAD